MTDILIANGLNAQMNVTHIAAAAAVGGLVGEQLERIDDTPLCF